MKDSLISLIVPVYNVDNYLDICIKSIVAQTYKNLEIILVDDGSTDSSPDICDLWAQKDSRIKVIHKQNGGLSDARNTGLKYANGSFVGFVDSDDYIDPYMYEKLSDVFKLHNNIGVASVKVLKDLNGEIDQFLEKCDFANDRIIKSDSFTKSIISQTTCWTVWNKLYRYDLIKNLEFKVGRNNEDSLFLFYLGQIIKYKGLDFYELSYPAYYYRIRENSICTNTNNPLVLDIIKNYEEMMAKTELTDSNLYNYIRLLYLKANIRFLDRMFDNPQLYDQYYKKHKRNLSSIPIKWVYKNCPIKTIIQYLLYTHLPCVRKFMLLVVKNLNNIRSY